MYIIWAFTIAVFFILLLCSLGILGGSLFIKQGSLRALKWLGTISLLWNLKSISWFCMFFYFQISIALSIFFSSRCQMFVFHSIEISSIIFWNICSSPVARPLFFEFPSDKNVKFYIHLTYILRYGQRLVRLGRRERVCDLAGKQLFCMSWHSRSEVRSIVNESRVSERITFVEEQYDSIPIRQQTT